MKFLKYRNDFIENKSELNHLMQTSTLVNEFLENDIRFGDSYFGRMINSSIQMLKTAYKTARIPFILGDLENQIQLMVDRIKFEQITKQFPTLFLKATLEEIKVCCTSTLTDEEKLEILIGWDGTFDPYDPNFPIKDIPSYYEGRKILTNSLVQSAYDKIDEKVMRERLEKAISKELIKSFLDTLSDFMDELRKYAYEMRHPTVSTPSSSKPMGFNLNLLEILKKIVNANLVPENSSYAKFLRYNQFINEQQVETKFENLSKLQDVAKKLIDIIESDSDLDVKSSGEYNELIEVLKSLDSEEISVLKSKEIINDLQNVIDISKTEKGSSEKEIEKLPPTEDQKKIETPISQTTGTKQVDKHTEVPVQKEQPSSTKQEVSPSVPNKNSNQTTTAVPTFSKPTTTSDQKTQVEKPKSEKEIEMEDDDKEKEGAPNPIQPLAENSKYTNYIQLVLEQVGTPPAPPLTSSTPPTPPSTPSTSTQTKNVETIWNQFFEEVEKVFPAKMTQDDVNKLKSFTAADIDLAESIMKKPDPLIKIIKLFETANSVYMTQVIPSGRTNGQVWPVTYRRYTYAGAGSPGGPSSPGVGPWIHNALFKQWKRGVIEIMGKPEFKDVFKNVKNLVEKFDRDFIGFDKIFEQDTLKNSDSLGELFLDLLKIKNQGEFDVYAAAALKKYFNVDIKPEKLKGNPNLKRDDLPMDEKDIDPNTFVWEPLRQTSFTRNNINQYFAFAVEDFRAGNISKKHDIIFVRPIEIDGDKVQIKFTYDHQGEGLNVQNSKKDSGKVDWSCDGKTKSNNIYYGIMKNDFRNGLQISYVNINNSVSASFKGDPIYGEPKVKGGVNFGFQKQKIRLNNGKTQQLYNARLIYFNDDKKKEDVFIPKNTSLVNEHLDSKLKELKASSGNLYDELIKKGKDNFGW
jgi:hypothetical protein